MSLRRPGRLPSSCFPLLSSPSGPILKSSGRMRRSRPRAISVAALLSPFCCEAAACGVPGAALPRRAARRESAACRRERAGAGSGGSGSGRRGRGLRRGCRAAARPPAEALVGTRAGRLPPGAAGPSSRRRQGAGRRCRKQSAAATCSRFLVPFPSRLVKRRAVFAPAPPSDFTEPTARHTVRAATWTSPSASSTTSKTTTPSRSATRSGSTSTCPGRCCASSNRSSSRSSTASGSSALPPSCIPGATHTRRSHSLGVFHLARRMIMTLVRRNRDVPVTLEGVKAFLCAALLHDIGHYPFAHSLKDLERRGARVPGRARDRRQLRAGHPREPAGGAGGSRGDHRPRDGVPRAR